MTEEGKLYWLRVKGTRHPFVYLGETKAGRGKYLQHVEKPSCCLVYKGGEKLDKYILETNEKNQADFDKKQAAFDLKYPPGTVPAEISPTLVLYEAVEVVSYVNKHKTAYKLKEKRK